MFIRFGEIPTNEKSINFFKVTNSQNSDFAFAISIGEIETAFSFIPSDAFEDGVSVFKVDDCENIKLDNMRLISSLANRIGVNEKCYLVDGDVVGIGNDGEPLINNIKIVKEIDLSEKTLSEFVFNKLSEVFEFASGERNETDVTFIYSVMSNEKEVTFNNVCFKGETQEFNYNLGISK